MLSNVIPKTLPFELMAVTVLSCMVEGKAKLPEPIFFNAKPVKAPLAL